MGFSHTKLGSQTSQMRYINIKHEVDYLES